MNAMQRQPLAHDGREARIIGWLAYFVSFDVKIASSVIFKYFLAIIMNLNVEVKVLEIEKCVNTTRLKSQVILKGVLIQDFLGHIKLYRLKNTVIFENLAALDISNQSFDIKLR